MTKEKLIEYYEKQLEKVKEFYKGGSSSGKSYFLAQKVVLDNLNGANCLICHNVVSTINKSTYNEICKAISNMGLMQYYKINKSNMTITCVLNDRQILFGGTKV